MEFDNILIIPGILSSFRSLKDGTLKVEFETNELTPNQTAMLAMKVRKYGYMAFKEDEFKNEQLAVIDELKADYEDRGKTPSKRLRDIFFIAYKQNDEGFTSFETYYQHHMEKYINHIKSKLD